MGHFRRCGVAVGSLLVLTLLLASGVACAETLVVTNSADSGAGSLRAAMDAANTSTTASTITFASATDGNAIVLGSDLPDILGSGGDLTITGNGAAHTLIDGANLYRPFKSVSGTIALSVQQLAVRNGFADQGQGGALYFYPGAGSSLSIDAVAFTGNTSGYDGGAIYSAATTTIRNSLFNNNTSGTFGAAVHADAGNWIISNTSFVGNEGGGASIVQFDGSTQARLVNLTVTGNNAHAGTIFASGDTSVSISNSLVVGNSHYDLANDSNATFDQTTSLNNIFSSLEPDLTFADGVNGNQIGVPELHIGSLADNGGGVQTLALLPGSAAIDAGTNSGGDIPTSDARGKPRLGTPDVGAFESQGFTLSVASGSNQSTEVDTAFAQPLKVNVIANDGDDPVVGGVVYFSAPSSDPTAVFATTSPTIEVGGTAQTIAYAKAVVGGPYTVSASLPNATADFLLTNLTGPCVGYAYPYTLSATSNTARVAELRQAVTCSNDNGLDDVIDLNAASLSFSDAPYGDTGHGASALPFVIGAKGLTLQNGALNRDTSAPPFRFIYVAAAATLAVDTLTFRHGSAGDDGGAILADGVLSVRGSRFEDNHAVGAGGAVAMNAPPTAVSFLDGAVVTSTFSGNSSAKGAALASQEGAFVMNCRFVGNGDASSQSVLWAGTQSIMAVDSLFAKNELPASGSSLLVLGDATSGGIAMRNVTVADNVVGGALLRADTVQGANNIIWGNSYTSFGSQSGSVSIHQSIVQESQSPGSSNRNVPPGFVDAAAGDYTLASGSPAIDAGDNAYSFPDALDLDHDGDVSELLPDLNLAPRLVDDGNVVDTGTSYNGDPVIDLGAFERQSDSSAAGISVTPTSGLLTTEAGGSATFIVKLDRYPTADVRVAFTSTNLSEGTVAPGDATFTTANWNQPHSITVTGVGDSVVDGDVAYTIVTSAATSADADYAGIDPADVSVTNQDVPPAHSIGGTISGLVGSDLSLLLNGGVDSLTANGNGNFVFATALPVAAQYSVSIGAQPSNPGQTCVVINGSGSVGNSDITDVVVNCGAANTYRVGGSVSGLASGQSVTLQLNGGGDLALSADAAYAFTPQLVDGASYVVTVKTQPQGQLCTLSNATGTVNAADVVNVDVACADLQAQLQLDVDDGHDYARYGQVRDYFVSLSNTGNAPASNVAISGAFSAAYDVANVHWQCISGGSGASCAAQGSGGFFDLATIPAHSSLMWIVSVPVLAGSPEPDATFSVGPATPSLHGGLGASVHADLPGNAADTDTLVIFRDGSDVPYADGTQAVGVLAPAAKVLGGDVGAVLVVTPTAASGIDTLRTLTSSCRTVAVQRLRLGGRYFVRLLGRDADGQERASGWASVEPGADVVLGSVADAADERLILLEGAAWSLSLPAATCSLEKHDEN